LPDPTELSANGATVRSGPQFRLGCRADGCSLLQFQFVALHAGSTPPIAASGQERGREKQSMPLPSSGRGPQITCAVAVATYSCTVPARDSPVMLTKVRSNIIKPWTRPSCRVEEPASRAVSHPAKYMAIIVRATVQMPIPFATMNGAAGVQKTAQASDSKTA